MHSPSGPASLDLSVKVGSNLHVGIAVHLELDVVSVRLLEAAEAVGAVPSRAVSPSTEANLSNKTFRVGTRSDIPETTEVSAPGHIKGSLVGKGSRCRDGDEDQQDHGDRRDGNRDNLKLGKHLCSLPKVLLPFKTEATW